MSPCCHQPRSNPNCATWVIGRNTSELLRALPRVVFLKGIAANLVLGALWAALVIPGSRENFNPMLALFGVTHPETVHYLFIACCALLAWVLARMSYRFARRIYVGDAAAVQENGEIWLRMPIESLVGQAEPFLAYLEMYDKNGRLFPTETFQVLTAERLRDQRNGPQSYVGPFNARSIPKPLEICQLRGNAVLIEAARREQLSVKFEDYLEIKVIVESGWPIERRLQFHRDGDNWLIHDVTKDKWIRA